jgi:hypothetical protein
MAGFFGIGTPAMYPAQNLPWTALSPSPQAYPVHALPVQLQQLQHILFTQQQVLQQIQQTLQLIPYQLQQWQQQQLATPLPPLGISALAGAVQPAQVM